MYSCGYAFFHKKRNRWPKFFLSIVLYAVVNVAAAAAAVASAVAAAAPGIMRSTTTAATTNIVSSCLWNSRTYFIFSSRVVQGYLSINVAASCSCIAR